ncbi:hypothetical protein [Streptomyces sp. NPDC001068]|uniref:hypothetical protein n=1 Tax=Streptomyces sp. NPDC001068 TaxID=3364544 RepID=UPI00367FBF84
MPTSTITRPTADQAAVIHAVLDSITGQHPPETFLWVVHHHLDGGATLHYRWTPGGEPLGDHVDRAALAAGLDAADWLHIGDLNCRRSTRGRFSTDAFALRPVLADVGNGVRSPEDRRAGILRVIERAAEETGRTARPGCPRWLGMGPDLLSRKTP